MTPVEKKDEGGMVSRSGTVQEWQTEVSAWAERTFGPSTPGRIMRHLREEVDEVETAPGLEIAEEIADCVFLLLRYASIHSVNLSMAMDRKFSNLQARTWLPPDKHGVIRHDKSGERGR